MEYENFGGCEELTCFMEIKIEDGKENLLY